MIDSILLGAIGGMFGIIWVFLLTEPGYLFSWWPDFIDLITPKRLEWIKKITYECEFCISGQFGLWGYLIYSIECGQYSFIGHVGAIVTAIFFTFMMTNKIIDWIEQ